MNESLKICDLVVITNQSTELPENLIPGGRIVMLYDTTVLVQRSSGALLSYKRENIRELKPEDMLKEGIELF